MRNEHADTTPKQILSATEAIHAPESKDTCNDLADIQDSRHGKLHFIVEAHGLEQSWRVIDECVDADELRDCQLATRLDVCGMGAYLLEEHETDTDLGSSPVGASPAETSLESV